jgi:hypothetical protein
VDVGSAGKKELRVGVITLWIKVQTSSALVRCPWVGLELRQLILQTLPDDGEDLRNERVRQLYHAIGLIPSFMLILHVHDVFASLVAACFLRLVTKLALLRKSCN